jgi:hypothetical protein
MSEKMQRRLLSLLVGAMFIVLEIPLKKLLTERVPGRRGPSEDVADAVLQGAARVVAVILASAFVRGLVEQRR